MAATRRRLLFDSRLIQLLRPPHATTSSPPIQRLTLFQKPLGCRLTQHFINRLGSYSALHGFLYVTLLSVSVFPAFDITSHLPVAGLLGRVRMFLVIF